MASQVAETILAGVTDGELFDALRARGYVVCAFGPDDADALAHRDFDGAGGFTGWLSSNANHIDEAMTRAGWEALEIRADMDGIPVLEPEESA